MDPCLCYLVTNSSSTYHSSEYPNDISVILFAMLYSSEGQETEIRRLVFQRQRLIASLHNLREAMQTLSLPWPSVK